MANVRYPEAPGSVRTEPWRIELLGGIRAHRGDTFVARFRTRRAAWLLARLALHPRSHTRVALIEMLWPGVEGERGRQNLSQALSELRRQMGADLLRASREQICLEPGDFLTDVEDFDLALAEAHACTGAARVAALERAVEIGASPLLPGVDGEWAVVERQRILDACDAALKELAEHHEQQGDLTVAFNFAWRRVRIDPLDEEAHRELARVYEHAGRPAAALRHLRELARELEFALGEAPDDATRALGESLRARLLSFARTDNALVTD